ncbi:MAG TPA: hypothetical protein VNO14_01715 [Blastocatellia bacterium]|nr:hypothetical protein [Blastocatellia bacterium]
MTVRSMKPLSRDTDEYAERKMVELARAMPVWKKLQQVVSMTEACRAFAIAGLRRRHPRATEEELRRRLAAVIFDRETVMQVFGWDPDIEGY